MPIFYQMRFFLSSNGGLKQIPHLSVWDFYRLRLLLQHMQADHIGCDGHNIKSGGNVVVEMEIIGQPQDHGDDDNDFQPGNTCGIQIPGE